MNLQDQIEELDAVRRLLINPDFKRVFEPMLKAQAENAHQAILSPDTTGERLEYARARYVACRELAHFLRDKEQALSTVIAKKQGEVKYSLAESFDKSHVL